MWHIFHMPRRHVSLCNISCNSCKMCVTLLATHVRLIMWHMFHTWWNMCFIYYTASVTHVSAVRICVKLLHKWDFMWRVHVLCVYCASIVRVLTCSIWLHWCILSNYHWKINATCSTSYCCDMSHIWSCWWCLRFKVDRLVYIDGTNSALAVNP